MRMTIALAVALAALASTVTSANARLEVHGALDRKERCEQLGYEEGSRKHIACLTYLKNAEAFDRLFDMPLQVRNGELSKRG